MNFRRVLTFFRQGWCRVVEKMNGDFEVQAFQLDERGWRVWRSQFIIESRDYLKLEAYMAKQDCDFSYP